MDFLNKVLAGTLAALLGQLLAEEVNARLPYWTEFFTKAAVRLLPERFQKLCEKKWRARLGQTPGQISKFVWSVRFLWAVSFKISIAICAFLMAVLRETFLAAGRIRAAGFAITTISVARFLDRLGNRLWCAKTPPKFEV